jgi:hypothetical protein
VPRSTSAIQRGQKSLAYGPIDKAFLALDARGQAALAGDLIDTIARFNTAADGSMRVPSDYAEVIVTKA